MISLCSLLRTSVCFSFIGEISINLSADSSSSVTILVRQVCDDIFRIWDYILTERCQIGSKLRPRFSAVLVVPDTLDNRGEALFVKI